MAKPDASGDAKPVYDRNALPPAHPVYQQWFERDEQRYQFTFEDWQRRSALTTAETFNVADLDFLLLFYMEHEIPPCRVCGDKLDAVSMGGGRATEWACSENMIDPAQPNGIIRKPGWDPMPDRLGMSCHYAWSKFTQTRQGDKLAINLIRQLREARAKGC